MKTLHVYTTRILAIAALVLTAGGTVWANGQQFFPAGDGVPVDLAYFGRVRDANTGRLVSEYPYVTITDRATGLFFPFSGDSFGHFRSPDIGAAVTEVLGAKVDPSQLEIEVVVPGYRKVTLTKAPRQAKGAVEINFKMVPQGSPGGPGGSEPFSEDRGVPAGRLVYLLLVGGFALVVTLAAGRTLALRLSTKH